MLRAFWTAGGILAVVGLCVYGGVNLLWIGAPIWLGCLAAFIAFWLLVWAFQNATAEEPDYDPFSYRDGHDENCVGNSGDWSPNICDCNLSPKQERNTFEAIERMQGK